MSPTRSSTSRPKARLKAARLDYALRMGDNGLILSHRLSQWMAKAHSVEEDIALGNIALDLLGQARSWLSLAGRIEGRGRGEDALAFFRDEGEFRNLSLVEQPNGDFACTIVRQFLYDARARLLLERLASGADREFAGIAAKSLKETSYHIRHSASWLERLADGTEESRGRVEAALAELGRFCGEMVWDDPADALLADAGIVPAAGGLLDPWLRIVSEAFAPVGLPMPEMGAKPEGWCGQLGRHTEHLGYVLAEMQRLPRAHPGASW